MVGLASITTNRSSSTSWSLRLRFGICLNAGRFLSGFYYTVMIPYVRCFDSMGVLRNYSHTSCKSNTRLGNIGWHCFCLKYPSCLLHKRTPMIWRVLNGRIVPWVGVTHCGGINGYVVLVGRCKLFSRVYLSQARITMVGIAFASTNYGPSVELACAKMLANF